MMNKAVVLISEALTGMGRAAAVAFTTKGAKLVVAGRRDAAGFINADIRKEDCLRALVDRTQHLF